MRKTEWLIFGATFLGFSFAMKKENCVILEEGCTIGPEFVENFNQKEPKPFNPVTKDGEVIKNILLDKNFISETGEYYPTPMLFEFAKLIEKKQDIEIHFDTVVTAVSKENDGFLVEFSNCNGKQTIFAKNILDTTSCGVFRNNKRSAFFAAAVESKGEVKNEIMNINFIFVPFDKDFTETRKNVFEKAKKLGTKIMMLSNSLCYRDEVKPYCENDIHYAPSDGFYNPLFAFEGGVLLAEEL